MRYVILLVPLLGLLALACNGGGEAQPTATAEPDATATPAPEASPTREPTAGTIVFLRGPDLWVASLDGESVPPRAITLGSLGARYVGFARGPDGEIDLYYTRQLTEATETERVVEFSLSRVALQGGTPEELLRFSSFAFVAFSYSFLGSVSPDGEHVVYTDVYDLSLLDLATGESSRLLESGTCALESYSECYGYTEPQWSPDGDVVMVKEILWEEARTILMNPFESPIDATEAGYGFGRPEWSPDGERLCIWEGVGLDAARIGVHSISTGETTDILAQLPMPTPVGYFQGDVFGCAWSADGQLAVGYAEDFGGPGRIAILDSTFSVIAQSDTIENLDAVVAWLPDGSGVVYNRHLQGESQEAAQRPPGLFDLQRGIVDLPFEADLVLGVLP